MNTDTSRWFVFYSLLFFVPPIIISLFTDSPSSEVNKHTLISILESMEVGLTEQTLFIVKSNIFVMTLLWLVAFSMFLVHKSLYRKVDAKRIEGTRKLTLFIYIFFFLKEGIRIGIEVYQYSSFSGYSTLLSFLTLVVPHALFEFFAFISISILANNWMTYNLHKDKFIPARPLSSHVLAPLFLILCAAIVETTVTTTIFIVVFHKVYL